MSKEAIQKATEHFARLLEGQLDRVERMKKAPDWIDYAAEKPIRIGLLGGDGIGPFLSKEARFLLEHLLQDEIRAGKVTITDIPGLTIENRAKVRKAIPDDVLEEIRKHHVTLKGPTTTPRKGDPWPNIESCNVAMRRELDLFANVRPVRVPSKGIDWIFFRENTEGAYVLGSSGIDVTDDLSFDFTVATEQGCERIIRMAFEYARRNQIPRVTMVTKANVIKTTDGRFLDVGRRLAKDYPELRVDDWYIDIMTAKLVDEKRRTEFRVFVLPNLYGDILTDEAAEFQGGVGTAGSANIGKRYAMFEAIHGSAPRMVEEGRAEYADPSSLIRAASMMLNHLGFEEKGRRLERALDLCGSFEKKLVVTGRKDGATGRQYAEYLRSWLDNPKLAEVWESYRERATG